MIIKEYYATREDGVRLFRTYSDLDLKICKFGTQEVYDEAIDVDSAPYSYYETDIPIERVEDEQ